MRMRSVTPQQQLWKALSQREQNVVRPVLAVLRPNYQEDLCYALLAYINYGMCEPTFLNPFLRATFSTLITKLSNINRR